MPANTGTDSLPRPLLEPPGARAWSGKASQIAGVFAGGVLRKLEPIGPEESEEKKMPLPSCPSSAKARPGALVENKHGFAVHLKPVALLVPDQVTVAWSCN